MARPQDTHALGYATTPPRSWRHRRRHEAWAVRKENEKTEEGALEQSSSALGEGRGSSGRLFSSPICSESQCVDKFTSNLGYGAGGGTNKIKIRKKQRESCQKEPRMDLVTCLKQGRDIIHKKDDHEALMDVGPVHG